MGGFWFKFKKERPSPLPKKGAAELVATQDTKSLQDILLAGNYIAQDDIKRAEKYAEKYHANFLDYLLAQKIITKDLLGQAQAEFFGVAYADLNSYQPSREQVLKIPEELAKKYRVVIFKETDRECIITTDNPKQEDLQLELIKIFKDKTLLVTYSLPEDIEASFVHYQKALETRFSQIIKQEKRVAPEILEEIFNDALIFRASDIHFEPQEKEVILRFRIDGVLHEAGRISKEVYENILNRVKVQARMRTDEHFASQDGAMRYLKKDEAIDARISIVPVLDGEKIVIRLLAEYVRAFALSDLGLSSINEKLLLTAARKPFGMVLVSGPTGSGKTTTLYSLIKFFNNSEINITTIEDPVEYKIPGINQIQVNPQTNLTFAAGLRSVIRQDPNIILVGEIRDRETAEIGVNASLTGHLLFSTFHANDAATAIPRLLDIGIEPFLLASTLELLIAQRLVRKICESCRVSFLTNKEALVEPLSCIAPYLGDTTSTLYKGKGCLTCSGTGFRGRTGIFECIPISEEMKSLILTNPTTRQIWDQARKEGARTMFEDGIEKVKNGITTVEELLRVAQPMQ